MGFQMTLNHNDNILYKGIKLSKKIVRSVEC